jgi:hypothetical protein
MQIHTLLGGVCPVCVKLSRLDMSHMCESVVSRFLNYISMHIRIQMSWHV